MPDHEASPRLIKFVRRALRAQPRPTFDEVLARWRTEFGNEPDTDIIQAVYDDELAIASETRPQDARHGQIVLVTVAIWLLLNVGIALALGLPSYTSCKQTGSSGGGLTSCGLDLGLKFLVVGVLQLVYGGVASIIAFRVRTAAGQGIVIGMGIAVVLFTVVCFGATTRG